MSKKQKNTGLSKALKLAHVGTKDSIKKLEDFIVKEKDPELRAQAGLALGEATYFYYSPRNKQEEKEFLLAKMVHERGQYILRLMGEADEAKLALEKMEIERDVHNELAKTGAGKKNWEDWKYNFSEDFYVCERNRYHDAVEKLDYESAWVETARKLIKNKKYLSVPEDVWEHIHWDGERHPFWTDDMPCPPPEDDFSDIEPVDIPF